jgi:ubiquinone/menaquinone biosynthesis C-methylase UbiE
MRKPLKTGPHFRGGHDYLPGFSHDALLPLYDVIQRLAGIPALHQRLVDRAGLGDNDDILEVGCGTGNLALLAKSTHPKSRLRGADPDPLALARAQRKAVDRGLEVRFDQAYGQDLPYADSSFDHVLSAFMLHHLDSDVKSRMLRDTNRVLRPGGWLHLVDFGGRVSRSDGPMTRLQRRSSRLRDNLGDAIPTRLGDAGFVDIREQAVVSQRIGRVTFYQATTRPTRR